MASKIAVGKALEICSGACLRYSPQLSDEGRKQAVACYGMVLASVPDTELMAGVLAWIRSENCWPTPADLLKASVVTPSVKWEDAWAKILESPRANSRPKIEDSLEGRCVEAGLKALGRWADFCHSTDSNIAADRAAFRDAFNAEYRRSMSASNTEEAKSLLADTGKVLTEGSLTTMITSRR
jgi:hypothetical protein